MNNLSDPITFLKAREFSNKVDQV